MAIPNKKDPKAQPRCAACGHFESEHGATGTRPCLVMVGELLDRNFCSCDNFVAKVAQAA
jgi:hypothetical protein